MCELITDFYGDRDIFVTGGSGLVGKALLEKLLRSCTGIRKVFVLIRDMKGTNGYDRLNDIKKSKIFDRIRKENPDLLNKLVAIRGDITHVNLGMTEQDQEMMKNVSIIFNVAATIRFDEPMKNAIMMNVRGTHEAIKFAKTLEKLTRFVHVSTAFTYPYRSAIYEEVYPAKADWRTVIKLAEKYDEDMLNALTYKILGIFPNSYTYTKHLAEQVVKSYSSQMPVSIVRPAIVHCCGVEPVEGWYDKLLVVMGMMTAISSGIIRTIYCNPRTILDLVPLDDCVKVFIITPWWIERQEKGLQMPVYNVSSSQIRSYSIETLAKIHLDCLKTHAFNKMIWIPNYGLTNSILNFYFRVYVFQVLPAMFLDSLIWLSGRKPFMLHIQRRYLVTQRALKFFMFNDYMFYTSRLLNLLEALKDNPEFKLDNLLSKSITDIVRISATGCRRYLAKEDDESIPQALKRYKIIEAVDFVISKAFQCWLLLFALNRIYGYCNKQAQNSDLMITNS